MYFKFKAFFKKITFLFFSILKGVLNIVQFSPVHLNSIIVQPRNKWVALSHLLSFMSVGILNLYFCLSNTLSIITTLVLILVLILALQTRSGWMAVGFNLQTG